MQNTLVRGGGWSAGEKKIGVRKKNLKREKKKKEEN